MNELLLYLINFFHILIILFVIIAPFLDINFLLVLHFIIIPFIEIHWILNDNRCGLTLIEKKIRIKIYGEVSEENSECLTCKLIEPIYDFKANNQSMAHFIYFITSLLWMITGIKLFFKYKNGEIRSFQDLRI